MSFSRLGAAALAAAALLSFVFPGAATAAPRTSSMALTVTAPGGTPTRVHLECDPAGGTHPKAEQACAELAAVNGDLGQLQQDGVACTMELRPVTARLLGTWAGKPVRWTQKFSNPCTLRAQTGTVFAF